VNLKEYRITIVISLCAFLFGLLLLVVRRHWIIIRWIPSSSIEASNGEGFLAKHEKTRKEVTLYAWKDDQLYKDRVRCIWGQVAENNIKNLVGNWLAFIYEERIISKRVQLESVALDELGQSVFLSFDRPLCERGWAIYKKWNIIKSLLKTIKMTNEKVQDVLFLVQQEVMQDDHLEFSQPLALGEVK
jgi:hypothetical protein